jgi:hypothetical protein
LALAILWPVAAAPRAAAAVWALPRGLATPDLKEGIVVNFQKGLDSIDLATGRQLWAIPVLPEPIAAPVAVNDGQVLVLAPSPKGANVAQINSIGTNTGKMYWHSEPLALPPWVILTPAPGHYFGTLSRVENGVLWVKWRALAWKPGAKKPPDKTATGVIRVDLQKHQAQLLDADKMPPSPTLSGLSPKLVQLATRSVDTPAGPEKVVLKVDNVVAAVDVEKGSVTLRRWDQQTEKPLAPITLATGGPFLVTPVASAGRVLVRPLPAQLGGPKGQVWQVFSLKTGQRLASVRVEPYTLDATILGSRLYYVFLGAPSSFNQPQTAPPIYWARQLKAVDLTNGQFLWSHMLEPLPFEPPSGPSCCCYNE